MAENIAALDPWYSRNIYTPFCYPSWTVPFFQAPAIEEDEPQDSLQTVEESNESTAEFRERNTIDGPLKTWSSLSQHYFQHAESKFSVPIFMCECWENLYDSVCGGDNAVFSSNMSIPFCSSLEIGIYPESIRRSMQMIILLMIQPIKMAIVPLNTKKILHNFGSICCN